MRCQSLRNDRERLKICENGLKLLSEVESDLVLIQFSFSLGSGSVQDSSTLIRFSDGSVPLDPSAEGPALGLLQVSLS